MSSLVQFLCQFGLWLAVWFMVMALGEYLIHRYTMHKKKWWLPEWVFHDHAIEHHHLERNDINIDLPLHYHLTIGAPLLLLASFISFSCFCSLLLVFMFHSYTWTKLHRGIHDLEDNWLKKTSYFKRAKKHHELHHERPGKNFGVVFLWTDRIFGTKYV